MQLENMIIEKREHVAILTINHPPANAWNLATLEDFGKALDALENDKDVWVIVLTGSGDKCFSAGFDVSDAGNAAKAGPLGRELWRRVDRFPKPFIAAINGFALGGWSPSYHLLLDDGSFPRVIDVVDKNRTSHTSCFCDSTSYCFERFSVFANQIC